MSESLLSLPVLPIKNTVLFPNLLLPLSVGRAFSIAAIQTALKTEEKELIVVTQIDPSVETPSREDLFAVGTRAVIKRSVRQPEGKFELIIMGTERVAIAGIHDGEYLTAEFRPLPLGQDEDPTEIEALHRELIDLARKILAHSNIEVPSELARLLARSDDPVQLAYLLASILSMDSAQEQKLLESETTVATLRFMHAHLTHELQVLELRSKIAKDAQSEIGKEQREYVLRQQLRAIQQELGTGGGQESEIEVLKDRLAKADLPDEVSKEANREIGKLERLSPQAPDYHVTRTWLDILLELPWKNASPDLLDIPVARQVLNEDHFGLDEVKQRILEHLGVLKLNSSAKAPILCFVGPPGVGKTSLGQSIARALGRKFERFSLGGVHDESELRGHRRTYIGAMPGRLIQALRRAGVNNPVVMLDEVDKLGRDFRGDPAAALLEVLDPEQNRSFRDNYLDLPFDISKVLFVTTANSLDPIPQPLLDRMEVVRLAGYSEEEKLEIATRYQIPRQLKEAGLPVDSLTIEPQALRLVITGYTREAGVRQLERNIGKIARKVALRHAEGNAEPFTLTPENLPDLLGPQKVSPEEARRDVPAGVATGLAWTEAGGDVLYIETALLKDGKGLSLTGQLGNVMQESAKTGQSYIWAHADSLGIDQSMFRRYGVHVHVPAGGIPKDGPSAGVTMVSALTSLYTGLPIRSDTAMTGEVTLSGLVLPVGGIKEKVLAARRLGIRRIILPKSNQKDLRDLPEPVRLEMEFIFAEKVSDVLHAAIPGIGKRLRIAA